MFEKNGEKTGGGKSVAVAAKVGEPIAGLTVEEELAGWFGGREMTRTVVVSDGSDLACAGEMVPEDDVALVEGGERERGLLVVDGGPGCVVVLGRAVMLVGDVSR